MNPLKAKRISRLKNDLSELSGISEELQRQYPTLAKICSNAPRMAQELQSLIDAGSNPPHYKPSDKVLAEQNATIASVLAKIVSILGDKVVLVGGLAVIHWVDIRKSIDIDFAILGSNLDLIKSTFPNGETKDLIYTTNIDGVDVDFLLPVAGMPWNDEAVRAAPKETVLGTPVKVLTPEYLILYKFYAGRDRDMTDIEALLTISGVPAKARKLIQKYMPEEAEDFESLVLLAEYNLK